MEKQILARDLEDGSYFVGRQRVGMSPQRPITPDYPRSPEPLRTPRLMDTDSCEDIKYFGSALSDGNVSGAPITLEKHHAEVHRHIEDGVAELEDGICTALRTQRVEVQEKFAETNTMMERRFQETNEMIANKFDDTNAIIHVDNKCEYALEAIAAVSGEQKEAESMLLSVQNTILPLETMLQTTRASEMDFIVKTNQQIMKLLNTIVNNTEGNKQEFEEMKKQLSICQTNIQTLLG